MKYSIGKKVGFHYMKIYTSVYNKAKNNVTQNIRDLRFINFTMDSNYPLFFSRNSPFQTLYQKYLKNEKTINYFNYSTLRM